MSCELEPITEVDRNSPASLAAGPSGVPHGVREPARTDPRPHAGRIIINADDWGRDRATTDRTLECWTKGSLSSASAMVFMEDSERAAALACERGLDAGLHLNFTTPFSAKNCPSVLAEHRQRVSRRLLFHRFSQAIFYPDLLKSFDYLVSAQLDEYCRLYGQRPQRLDGHHHMHLCANVLVQGLLPRGTMVRRSFSFQPGEKGIANRLYRRALDLMIARRHCLTDFFFSLQPLQPPARLQRIFALARQFVVEVETHPANPEEYRFLVDGEIVRQAGNCLTAGSSGIFS